MAFYGEQNGSSLNLSFRPHTQAQQSMHTVYWITPMVTRHLQISHSLLTMCKSGLSHITPMALEAFYITRSYMGTLQLPTAITFSGFIHLEALIVPCCFLIMCNTRMDKIMLGCEEF
jgi:hypothetical protein